MDKLKAVVEAMTLWNWLALVAFIFFPLSALNAFFGLRSRYRDWRGTKSKKAFEKRLKQLGEELRIIETFKNNILNYFVWVLDALVTPLKTFGVAFMLLLLAFVLPGEVFKMPIVLIGLFVTMSGAGAASHAFRVIRFMATPILLAIEIIDFVRQAADNGLESEDGKSLIVRLFKSQMFRERDRDSMALYIKHHYPSISSTVSKLHP